LQEKWPLKRCVCFFTMRDKYMLDSLDTLPFPVNHLSTAAAALNGKYLNLSTVNAAAVHLPLPEGACMWLRCFWYQLGRAD